jgi:hypothetical protein
MNALLKVHPHDATIRLRPPAPPCSNVRRFLAGGMGALTPIVLNYVVTDRYVVFGDLEAWAVVGYAIKVALLFWLGAVVAWMHQDEHRPQRLFQLGIVAPALVTTMMNGMNIDHHRGKEPRGLDKVLRPVDVTAAVLVTPARAQERRQEQDVVHSFAEPPRESALQQFLRGFLGWSERGEFFVVLEREYPTAEHAFQSRNQIRAAAGIAGDVYARDGKYLVVLGDWMEEGDAERLKETAAELGLTVQILPPPPVHKAGLSPR